LTLYHKVILVEIWLTLWMY